jgi:voltage-gated potassium channel
MGTPINLKSQTFKDSINAIVFGRDTRLGILFDQVLMFAIVFSLVVVILDSVESISKNYHPIFNGLEWFFTIAFSVEYLLRIYSSHERLKYIFSFFGIIDLLAVLPTYLALLFPDLHVLVDVRIFRLIRVFRVFKLTAYLTEYQHLAAAMAASRKKILVFLSVVLVVVMVMGTLMYVVEGGENGFTSIPVGIYWAITTMTTVGFGDIAPKTDLGKLLASVMMLMGWGTLAVPTGIVTAEMSRTRANDLNSRECSVCKHQVKSDDNYCSRCGAVLKA